MHSFTFRAQIFSLKKPEIFLTKVEQMPFKTQEQVLCFCLKGWIQYVCVYVFVLAWQAKSILSDPHELFLNKIKWTPRAWASAGVYVFVCLFDQSAQ